LNVFIVYSNVFIVYLNVFQCVWKFLNVFISIVIGISPSHPHCNVFAMRTHIYICFSLSTMTTFLTCYTTTLFSPIPIDLSSTFIQSMKKLHINPYFSRLYITPHSTFHVVTGCASIVESKFILTERERHSMVTFQVDVVHNWPNKLPKNQWMKNCLPLSPTEVHYHS
jgi:hypothetical protein